MVTKNKWLYPSEELSKMQPGTVFDSKTYPREIKDDNQKFTIRKARNKKKKG